VTSGTAPPPHPRGALHHRLSVDKLNAVQLVNAVQLDRLRKAFGMSGEKQDNTGFAWFAGLHGVPQHFCQHHIESEHGRRFFLPWHRAYLYSFELSLQELVDDVTLPWWDWTYDAEHPRLIPEAFARARLSNRRPNPSTRRHYR
jgi:tyrosinase